MTIRAMLWQLIELAVFLILLLSLIAAVVFGDAVLNGRPS